jgi:hypothetical protein
MACEWTVRSGSRELWETLKKRAKVREIDRTPCQFDNEQKIAVPLLDGDQDIGVFGIKGELHPF